MEQFIETALEYVDLYWPRVLGALLIFIIGRIVVGLIVGAIRKIMNKSEVDSTLTKFVMSLLKAALMTFVIISAIGSLGVQTTSFVAIIGAAGLAIGFALQGSLSNLASGVMLIIFRPFKAGDFVEVGGTSGAVQEVSIFTTTLHTPDNKKVIIPNSAVTSGAITNYSAQDTRRVDMVFGIGYGDDIRLAKQTLDELIKSDDRILTDPAPTVAVSELGDSSVNFVVRPWVKTADFWAVKFDFTEKVKLTFDEKGISIPFPQTDVHLYQTASQA